MFNLRGKVGSKSATIFFIASVILLQILGLHIYQKYNPKFRTTPSRGRPKVKVLILSLGRSGSTFLGQLFRENKNVMYLFEPLVAAYFQGQRNESLQFLNDVYNCNRLDASYLDFLVRKPSWLAKSSLFTTYKHGIPKRFGGNSLSAAIQSKCKQKPVIVTKVLIHRLHDGGLWGIKTLLDTHKDMKIIHLIRDPWRVLHSMREAGWFRGKDFQNHVKAICNTNWKNMQYVENNPLYFKDRCKRVVFTEMMLRPFKITNQLYAFLGMAPVPSYLYTWIWTNTRGSAGTAKGKENRFSTYRNTTAVLRKEVKFTEKESRVIREHCSDIIEFIENYKKEHDLLSVLEN